MASDFNAISEIYQLPDDEFKKLVDQDVESIGKILMEKGFSYDRAILACTNLIFRIFKQRGTRKEYKIYARSLLIEWDKNEKPENEKKE